MENSTIGLLIMIGVMVFLLAGIIYANANNNKNKLQRSGSFASMVAMHDMQTAEKQKAMETVIEQQSEKKWDEEENGEGEKAK